MRRRPTAVHYGVVAGLAAVAAQAFFGVDRPPAYGICIACHGEDAVTWSADRLFHTSLHVGSLGTATPLLTTVGVLVGAALAAARNGELRWARLGHPVRSTLLGALVGVSALVALGCTTRLWLRAAYGEPLAFLAVGAVVAGVAGATLLLAWRARRV